MSYRKIFLIAAISIVSLGALTIDFSAPIAEDLSSNTDQQTGELAEKNVLIQKQIAELIVQPQQNISASTNSNIKKDLITHDYVLLDAPFSSQAPFGNWKDPRQQSGCEEAAVLMAMRWVKNQTLTGAEAEREIIAIANYEQEQYGGYYDTSAEDTVKRIIKGYFKYYNVVVKHDIGVNDIKTELRKGNIVIIPVNGQIIRNPYYTAPGPLRHMMVVIGFDEAKQEVITHDPGTRRGENYRYKYTILEKSLQDYETGHDKPIETNRSSMIIISK